MKKSILIFVVLSLVLGSCTIEVNQPDYSDTFYLNEITVYEIDDSYIDLTVLEGEKDVYAEVFIGNQLVATTEYRQGARLPVTLDAPHFPLEIRSNDIGKYLSIDLYDRDPNEDDYLGSVTWRIDGFYGHSTDIFVYDGEVEVELHLVK